MMIVKILLREDSAFAALGVSRDGVVIEDRPHREIYVRVNRLQGRLLFGTILDEHGDDYMEPNDRGRMVPCDAMINESVVRLIIVQDAKVGYTLQDDGDLKPAMQLVDSWDAIWRSRSPQKAWLS